MSIEGNDNIVVDGDGNHIHILKENKRQFKLEYVEEKFRNYYIDYMIGAATIILTFLVAGFGGLGLYASIIPPIIGFLYLYYLPKKLPFMYIYVYNDRFKYLINQEVLYSDIKTYKYRNNGFYWRQNKPKEKSLTLHNNDNAFFIFDCIERYSIITGTKLY
jgi:hypothetical protein